MPLSYLLRRPSPALVALLGATALLVVAALAGALPSLAAATLSGAVGCALAGLRLSRLASVGGRSRRARRCRRAAAQLDAAVLVVGLTVAVLPLAAPSHRPEVAAAGLLAAAVSYLGGLLTLPGHSRLTARARLRRGVDTAGLGTALVFAGWVLLPPGVVPVLVRVVTVVGAVGLAGLLVSALADRRRRPGAALCRAGAAGALLGLADLVVLSSYRAPQQATLTVVPFLLAGVLLTAYGATRVAAGDPPLGNGPAPAWPRVTAPAAVAGLAAGHHLWAVGDFTPTAALLGLAVIPPLIGRELITAADNRDQARQLAAREAHFRALVTGGRDLILILDDELRVRWLSAAGPRWFGLRDDEVRGRPLADLLHPDDVPAALAALTDPAAARPPLLVARMSTGDGGWRETEATVSDQRGVPEVDAVVLHVRDIGERRRLERELHRLAAVDQPTGLANRRELVRVLGERRPEPATLLLVDLHGLGAVTERSGVIAGEAVLRTAVRRLRDVVGSRDLVARVAGEEFAVVSDLGPVPAYALGGRLVAALAEPCPASGEMVRLRVSVGLAELAGAGPEDALRQADLARRRAAQLGHNRVEWYDAYLEEQLVRRLDLERELPGAVARGELDLVFQPVLGLADRLPVGAEALLRWRSPVLGTVLPAELLPVAEDLDLVGELGRWVLERSCRQLAEWSAGGRRLWMAVNVTPRELLAPDFLPGVAAVLAAHGVPADRLVVEVAEHRLGAEPATVVARMAGLRSLGVRTALDGFRAEQASLAQLRRLPIDLLKVRPQLVATPDGPGRPMIDVVVSLGERLGLTVVGEALESDADVDLAYRAGCRYGQGFALVRPATAERVEAFFAEFPSASR
ncbi:bifunctional diguanylate cyclase/phosphodiesterase [Micromonospora sp. KC723]|uniref:putative bifunctional diguanylate cyclase/phosphodiesterase n=1 Tax=Micromonospora sp. KC723 TaxID=2530381 RepID=UPI001FB70594|nr:sensor domain-containing phosphodiesterase [Micromonospora sp. KC723]